MYEEVLEGIRRSGTGKGLNLVAYSGGVDSAVVARLVLTVYPANTVAVIGISASMPATQLQMARDIAAEIGVPLRELMTAEGDVPEYVENAGFSCYHCKTTLYRMMQTFAGVLAEELQSYPGGVVLFNGTNADDLEDPTRVGLEAAREFRVESPLRALPKAQVRALSHLLGLTNWDYAASPCLRSRLQYGVPATPENLARVERAEQVVRDVCHFGPKDNLRVRHLVGDVARIEVDAVNEAGAREKLPLLEEAFRALGYGGVEIGSFRSGSISYLPSYTV